MEDDAIAGKRPPLAIGKPGAGKSGNLLMTRRFILIVNRSVKRQRRSREERQFLCETIKVEKRWLSFQERNLYITQARMIGYIQD